MISVYIYDYMACIDYMNSNVRCPLKAVKLNHSLIPLLKETQDMIQNVNSSFIIFKAIQHAKGWNMLYISFKKPYDHTAFSYPSLDH